MSEWISVEDEFPIIGVSVLTIGKKNDGSWTTPITAHLYDDGSVLRFISGFSFGGDRLIRTMVETKATHWQPLPDPPKNRL